MTTSKKKTNIIYAWIMWLIAAIFYAMDYFQHTAPSVLIGPIAESMRIPVTTVGNIMSVYFPVYAVTQIPAGYLLDKFNIRYVLSCACLVVSLGLFFSTYPNEVALLIGRIFIALGSAFAFLGAIKTASLWIPEKDFPFAVGLTNTVGVLGGLLGQPILNEMILQYHWQEAVRIIIFSGLLIALLLFLTLQQPAYYTVKKTKGLAFKYVVKIKSLWLMALYAGIMVGAIVNALTELYGVIFLQQTNAISSETASIINSMTFIGIAIGGPLHGFISSTFNNKRQWMLYSNIATTALFASLALVPLVDIPTGALIALYFLIGFFVSSMLLSFGVIRSHFPKENHASIFAFVNMIIAFCGAAFQLIFGNMIAYLTPYLPSVGHHIIYSVCIIVLIIPLIISGYFCQRIKKAKFLLPAH